MMADEDYGMRRFRLLALTPIHIGSGERLSPEEYVYDEAARRLVRINFAMFLRLISKEVRERFERMLDEGRMGEAQRMVAEIFSKLPPKLRRPLTRSETEVGDGSAEEFRQLHARMRSGEIFTMARNPYSDRVTVPGSALKGAMRTAVVSQTNAGSGRAIDHDRIDEWLILGYDRKNIEGDPFRLMQVSDAEWPADGVSIDRAVPRKLGGEDRAGIQIHEERLKSRVDGYEQGAAVEIRLKRPDGRQGVNQPLTWQRVVEACNGFYSGRLKAERERFPFVRERAAAWEPGELGPGRILVRMGKQCHFDSLSVDGARRKYGRNGPEPQAIGSTRTVCRLRQGQDYPHGWAVLEAL